MTYFQHHCHPLANVIGRVVEELFATDNRNGTRRSEPGVELHPMAPAAELKARAAAEKTAADAFRKRRHALRMRG